MKKCMPFLLLAFLLLLASCGKEPPAAGTPELPPVSTPSEKMPDPDVPPVSDPDVVDIVDRTQIEPLTTADALEGFWQDEEYNYYFPSIKSHYIIVLYSNGSAQTVKEALAEGRITLADLDRFGIGYGKEVRVYITEITDRDTMDTAVDVFFTGVDYYYYFPSIHETTVHYSDGTSLSLKEAMAEFRVTVEDLDRFGIKYFKSSVKEVAGLDYRDGVLTALGHFWSDAAYDYYFPCCDTEVTVIFTDGTRMELAEALERDFVSVEILDQYQIHYYREPRVPVSEK